MLQVEPDPFPDRRMEVCCMKCDNSVSLTGCTRGGCGWYDDWCCSGSCQQSCGCNGICANGCGSIGGCQNGCGACQNGCSNGCGCSICQQAVNAAWGGCSCNGCGFSCCHNGSSCYGGNSCTCCSSWWPDAPALPSGGFLVNRVVASGRACQRASDISLCVQDLPECAQPPFALVSVIANGPVDWEFIAIERRRALLRVTIPLTAQVKDCAGCIYTGHSSVTVELPVHVSIPQSDLGRTRVEVSPGVRLLCVSGCSEDGCFTATLAVLVDVYISRWELSSDGVTVPCRPDLPLTLPPSFPCRCR